MVHHDYKLADEIDEITAMGYQDQSSPRCPYVGCNGILPPIAEKTGTEFCPSYDNPCYPMPEGVYITDDEYSQRHDALCEK